MEDYSAYVVPVAIAIVILVGGFSFIFRKQTPKVITKVEPTINALPVVEASPSGPSIAQVANAPVIIPVTGPSGVAPEVNNKSLFSKMRETFLSDVDGEAKETIAKFEPHGPHFELQKQQKENLKL